MMKLKNILIATLVSLACVTTGQRAWGADSEPVTQDFVQQIMMSQERLASINRRIEREKRLVGQGPLAEQTARNRNVARLQETKFIYQRLLNTLKKNISLFAEQAELLKRIESGEAYALAETKPYSLSFYDKLLDQVTALEQEKEVLRTSITSVDRKLEEGKNELASAEQTWRRVKERLGTQAQRSAEDDLEGIQAQLDREVAEAQLAFQKVRKIGHEGDMRLVDLKYKAAQQKLAMISQDLAFDPDALGQEITRLDKQKRQLNTRLQSVLDEQKKVALQWQTDRATASGRAAESAMQAREAWREAYEKILQQTEEMTQLLTTQERLWTLRYSLVKGESSAEEIERLSQEVAATRQHTQQSIGLYQTWQVNLQSSIAALVKDQDGLDPMVEKYATYHLKALNTSGEFGSEYFSMLLTTGQLAGRFLDEIAPQEKQISFWDKTVKAGSRLDAFWNFELWVIDDNGVTVRKVVTALVILILGFMVVRRAIRLLSARLSRGKLEAGAIAAAEKLLLYSGFVLIVLFALRTVNIPLTAFTFLGGAIAIGLGFGAQNLINNFISGFIIMAERPIRIGDLIELEGTGVRVEEIGARCTKVKTGENIHILVPNSSFLEKNITNWTLSDQKFRAQVTVGVAYGSPVEQVTELLLQAADQTERILKTPNPFVIFDDFGDSALTFEVYFWVIIRGVIEKKRIASDLRYQINQLFSDHKITIAFPQQDIHVDSIQPLQVHVSSPRPDGKS